MRTKTSPRWPVAMAALVAVAALLAGAVAPVESAPVFSYFNDTGDPTVYKYILFNPSSTFEVFKVELEAPGATIVSSPPGWTAAIVGSKVVWETTPGTFTMNALDVLAGFEIKGIPEACSTPFTTTGQQFTFTERTLGPVPEPASILVLGSGLVGAALRLRRTK